MTRSSDRVKMNPFGYRSADDQVSAPFRFVAILALSSVALGFHRNEGKKMKKKKG